jgi:hypothetical protein
MNQVKQTPKNLPQNPNQSTIDNWFTSIIEQIKVDHMMISEKVAPTEKQEFYSALINGNEGDVLYKMRGDSSRYFIERILKEYLNEINKLGKPPIKLAFGLSDSKLLVWSEIEDNDEVTEDALLIAEAKVNGKYYSKGFYINSTIIEQSDNVPVPPHYQTIIA